MRKPKPETTATTFIRISVATRDRLRTYTDRNGLKMGPFADRAILDAMGRAPSTTTRKRAS